MFLRTCTEILGVDPVFLYAQAHDPFRDVEHTGGTRHVTLGGFQGIHEQFALEVVEGLLQRAVNLGIGALRRLQARRKVMGMDDAIHRQQNGAFNAVLQFPHVSRPVVVGEQVDRGGGDALDRLVITLPVLADKVVRQEQNIVATGDLSKMMW